MSFRFGRTAKVTIGGLAFICFMILFHLHEKETTNDVPTVSRVAHEAEPLQLNFNISKNRPTNPPSIQASIQGSVPQRTATAQLPPDSPAITQLMEPNWKTTSFKSPVLKRRETTEAVDAMFATSKRLRHLYVNPKLKFDKFTIVMLTYNRTGNLYTVFNHYCKMARIIDKILIIWNNIGVPIPDALLSVPCSFPIVILPQTHNSLNNRFIPYPEIQTECVFSLDDDHLMTEMSLEAGFNIWKGFPHLLVGYVPRTHGFKDGKYYYQRAPVRHGETYSIVLTVAMYMNYKYLDLYTYHAPKEIIEFSDTNQNGEDIAMVAVVSDYLRTMDKPQCSCLWVRESMKEIKSNKKGKPSGLHHLSRHFEERDDCLNLLARLYKTLPIEYCSIEVRKIKK